MRRLGNRGVMVKGIVTVSTGTHLSNCQNRVDATRRGRLTLRQVCILDHEGSHGRFECCFRCTLVGHG